MPDRDGGHDSPFGRLANGLLVIIVAGVAAVGAMSLIAIRHQREVAVQGPEAKCTGSDDCGSKSLKAYIRAANASEDSVNIAVWQLGLSILALSGAGVTIIYAHRAWREAEKSANAARDALADARAGAEAQKHRFDAQINVATRHADSAERTAEGQLRAYVHMESASVSWINDLPHFRGVCHNTGRTPAMALEVGAVYEMEPLAGASRTKVPDDVTLGDWGAIGGGSSREVMMLSLPVGNVDRSDIEPVKTIMTLRGRVRYRDVSGVSYESEFVFFAATEHDGSLAAMPGQLRMYRRVDSPDGEAKARPWKSQQNP